MIFAGKLTTHIQRKFYRIEAILRCLKIQKHNAHILHKRVSYDSKGLSPACLAHSLPDPEFKCQFL